MMSNLDVIRVVAALVLALGWATGASGGTEMQLKRLTTVVFTDDVDACSTFYTRRLGFEQTMAVPTQQPGETGNQFVAITNGRHELMFQTFKSAEADAPGAVAPADPPSFMLYLEVASLDLAIEGMKGLEPAITRRRTFYGSEEIGYRDPCGIIVVLAEFHEDAQDASEDEER
jgi:catechol 2,3-dioxygenase-like lactoylglutathione lyase family enzyme